MACRVSGPLTLMSVLLPDVMTYLPLGVVRKSVAALLIAEWPEKEQ